MGAASRMLPDGKRLHLHHGPIDLVVWADDGARVGAYARAKARFDGLLEELVLELADLRRPDPPPVKSLAARRMQAATAPFLPAFITPMAAVAGAVADEVLSVMIQEPDVRKAYVNNGGDIAFHLTPGESVTAAMAGGEIRLDHATPWRGIATSGWRGRSHSLGIADAVTVIADCAARADAAATLIANAVDLPAHPAITRVPARDLSPDSDLGDRLVTTKVGQLSEADVEFALNKGLAAAQDMQSRGLIGAAYLELQGRTRVLAAKEEMIHA